MRFPSLRAFATMLLLGAASSATVPAAAQIATAALSGTVRDDTGAALPNTAVTVKSDATGATRRTTTGGDGRYRFAALDRRAVSVDDIHDPHAEARRLKRSEPACCQIGLRHDLFFLCLLP